MWLRSTLLNTSSLPYAEQAGQDMRQDEKDCCQLLPHRMPDFCICPLRGACVCKLLETRRFDMFALKQKVRLCWFSPFSPSFSTKNFEQGDTAYHWDCVQRSYQWYGISGLISQTYLLQKWQEAKPRTSLRCSFTRQGKNFHAVQFDLL